MVEFIVLAICTYFVVQFVTRRWRWSRYGFKAIKKVGQYKTCTLCGNLIRALTTFDRATGKILVRLQHAEMDAEFIDTDDDNVTIIRNWCPLSNISTPAFAQPVQKDYIISVYETLAKEELW